MDCNFYLTTDTEGIKDLIKILKKTKKKMKELSNGGETPIRVTIKDSTISELQVGKVKYKAEYNVGVKL